MFLLCPKEEEYQDALAEAKELAATRLTQIEELLKSLAEVEQKVEMAELESKSLPETTIKETAVYKSLQSNFSVAYAENLQLRTHLEEAKQLLVVVMSQHHTQVRGGLLWAYLVGMGLQTLRPELLRNYRF